MESRLDADARRRLLERLRPAPGDAARGAPSRSGAQPIHTVYVAADAFTHDLAPRWGAAALAALAEHAPDGPALLAALGVDDAGDLAERVRARVVARLRDLPVQDVRLDFEDGYGERSDGEEDEHATSSARAVARAIREGTAPPSLGLRVKALEPSLAPRALATLDRFVAVSCFTNRSPHGSAPNSRKWAIRWNSARGRLVPSTRSSSTVSTRHSGAARATTAKTTASPGNS